MAEPPEPLVRRYPILHRLRRIDSWWTLAAVGDESPIDARAADEALDALIALDRSWNDYPSAQTHGAVRHLLAHLAEMPLVEAFDAHAARQRALLPAQLAAALADVDRQVAQHLTSKDQASLLAAEQLWIEVARANDLDVLPVPLRLSLVCDAAQLHQAAFAVEPTHTRLESLVGILEVAVKLFRSVQAHPPVCRLHLDPRLQTLTAACAIALRTRFATAQHHRRDLDDAERYQRALLNLTHPAAPDLPVHLAEYGKTLGYFGEDGIEAGLRALDEAGTLEPTGSNERIGNFTLAAKGRLTQFAAGQGTAPLDDAIGNLRMALAEAQGGGIEEPSRVLAEALLRRAVATKTQSDATEAAILLGAPVDGPRLSRASLAERLLEGLTPILPSPQAGALIAAALDAIEAFTTPDYRPATAAHAGRLARLLYAYDAGRDLRHVLDRVILLLEAARKLDGNSTDAAARENQLALFYGKRFALFGNVRDLGAAVAAALRASTSATIDLPARRAFANTHGVLLLRRYEVVGAPTDLAQAIAAFSYAVPASRNDRNAMLPGQVAGVLGNLGSALRLRAERQRDSGDLDRAIEILTEAEEEVHDASGADAAIVLSNLAAAYHDRWRKHQRPTDLDAAIDKWTEAEKEYERDRRPDTVGAMIDRVGEEPDIAAALERWAREGLAESIADTVRLNRGGAMLDRYLHRHHAGDLDEALTLLQAAVPAMEPHGASRPLGANRIAEAFHQRFLQAGHADDLAASTVWSRRAVGWAAGASVDAKFRVAWDWGGRASAVAVWPDAAEAYGQALMAIRALFETTLLWRDRESLMAEAFGLPTRAAFAMSRAGDLRGAVVALEYGRALLLAEALGVLDAQLETRAGDQHADLLARYRAVTTRSRALATRIETPSPDAEPVNWSDIDEAQRDLLEIRSQLQSEPALAPAFAPPAFEDVAAIVTTPTVYFVPGPDAGLAILVESGSSGPTLIPLPEFGEKTVGRQTNAFVSAYEKVAEDEARWVAALDHLTGWLGEAIAPVRTALQGKRAVFIPTGALVFLPLHAAWAHDQSTRTGRRYVLDDAVISYAPSALSVAAARRRPSAGKAASSLLGISNPRPSGELPLVHAAAEVARAASLFGTSRILDEHDATVEAGRALIGTCHVVHYACHARSMRTAPRQSGIVHADDRMLTVGDLVNVDLAHAKLAVLSACETGVPGVDAPDELIGLATALFGAGFDGVVASLWPILDASALLLVTRFYEYWRGVAGPAHDAAESLVLAQRWVRDTTNGEKRRHWDALAAQGRLPPATHEAIMYEVALRQTEGRDFAAPDDWAPFMFTGIW